LKVIVTTISQKFSKSSALLDDDEELEKLWKKEYPLQTFFAPENFIEL